MLCLRRLRRPWLAAVIPLIAVAVATSCSDDPTAPSGTPDSGAQPGQLGQSFCPDAAPEAGEGCVVPEGTTCSFGACSEATIAQCTRGAWRFGGNPPPLASCPSDFPVSGQTCPACFPANLRCRYGTCDGADATANVSSASCDGGVWSISIVETCPPRDSGLGDSSADAGPKDAGPDGPKDAGADVQGDADADVD